MSSAGLDRELQEMKMLTKALKITAIAALLGLGVTGAATTSASAYTVKTRCTGVDCVRLQCNDWGNDCFWIGYFDRDRYDYDRSLPYGYERTYVYPDYAVPDYAVPDNGYDYYHDYDYPY